MRLPYPDPSKNPEFADVVAELAVSRGQISNIQRSMGHSPEGLRRFAHLGDFIRYRSSLPPSLREIVIVVTGRHSSYAVLHHGPLALQAGVTQTQLDALVAGEIPATFGATEQAVVRFVHEFVSASSVSDATFGALAARLTPRELTDVSFTAAYYCAALLMGAALQVEHDREDYLRDEMRWQHTRDQS